MVRPAADQAEQVEQVKVRLVQHERAQLGGREGHVEDEEVAHLTLERRVTVVLTVGLAHVPYNPQ